MPVTRSFYLILTLLLVTLPGCLKQSSLSKKDVKIRKKHSISRTQKVEHDESPVEAFAFDDEDLEEFALQGKQKSNTKNQQLFSWEDPTVEDSKEQFKTLYFGFNKNTLSSDSKDDLEHNIKYVKRMLKKGKTIIVEGHSCHSAGSAAYNLALSQQRAEHVASKLVDAGFNKKHIKVVGRGHEMPLRKGGSREEQWPNRRIEIFAIDI